ncbi:MAG: hypothetical protein CR991_02115 [Proteobacteria bacterium]|nr:MAG: hypothetical protein CR991_02115 [Pseudomonadota bacterium]
MEQRLKRPSKEEMSKPAIELWQGWFFYESAIFDPAGNRYTQRDISLSWEAGLIVDGVLGRCEKIKVLKNELEERIRMTALPKVAFIWDDEKGVTEKVFKLSPDNFF